jgi:hypothetical protein
LQQVLSLFGSEFYTALRAAQFFSSPFSLFLLEHQLANFAGMADGRAAAPIC